MRRGDGGRVSISGPRCCSGSCPGLFLVVGHEWTLGWSVCAVLSHTSLSPEPVFSLRITETKTSEHNSVTPLCYAASRAHSYNVL